MRSLRNEAKMLVNYWRAARSFDRTFGLKVPNDVLSRCYLTWRRTQRSDASPIDDRMPWLTVPTLFFLSGALKPGMRVFEYGTGGSTLFFLDREALVFSVEHDEDWLSSVSDAVMASTRSAWTPQLRAAEPPHMQRTGSYFGSPPCDYHTSDVRWADHSFRAYTETICDFPDAHFDIVLVDGRARVSCFLCALPKVKPGGHIIVDNLERSTYARVARYRHPDFDRQVLPGPTPYVDFFTITASWQKRS